MDDAYPKISYSGAVYARAGALAGNGKYLPVADSGGGMNVAVKLDIAVSYAPPSGTVRAAEKAALQKEFERLVKKWKRETAHYSLTKQQISTKSYFEILVLGDKALPLIFEEFAKDPMSGWIPALEVMTKQNPAINSTSYRETVKLWVEWGRNNGYLQ